MHKKEAAPGYSASDKSQALNMTSKYGKQYMQNQALEAQERKNHKLTTHVKKEGGHLERT